MPRLHLPRLDGNSRLLLSLILAQLAVNTSMAGVRMAAPLQALEAGHAAWSVGLLLALFTLLPVLTAMPTGRMTDRWGYHRPLQLAVGLTVAGSALALLAVRLPGLWQFGLLCFAAAAAGAGANICGIATQRSGGRLGTDASARLRIFSWLAMAPSLASAVGPVASGVLIDGAGFGWAYALMAVLPLAALLLARGLPRETGRADATAIAPRGRLAELLAVPGLRRLLFVNWLLSASWDVHSFAVPVLGHARQFSASTIGLVLGAFTLAVTMVRVLIPLLAHRINEGRLLSTAMLVTALIFAVYPFAASPWQMGISAALLGLALGAVQPTVVSALYAVAPEGRHGEVIAFRSMAISVSNTVMPLAFGLGGSLLGPGVMFWLMGAAVGSGSWIARGLRRSAAPSSAT
ncbi:MFS transporter [Piscinibacter sakaiensis]|uniref:MFS transporter n=1 Tax=Piscinibacter sakaiensis TaxID=1547922 RepID=UPI003AAAC3FC